MIISSGFNRDEKDLISNPNVPSGEAANDTSVSQKPIALPAGITLLRTLKGYDGRVMSVSWSPDGRQLATGFDDEHVLVWEPSRGELLLHTFKKYKLKADENMFTSVKVNWSPDGRLLALGTSDGTVRVWELDRDKLLYTLKSHTLGIWSMSWSPDGRLLALSSGNRAVWLWEPSQDKLYTLDGHTDWVISVSWSPDGKQLASGSDDRTIRIWEPSQGKLLHTLGSHASRVTSVSWSPDGKQLASSSDDGTVRIWEPSQGKLLHTLESHASRVTSVSWSHDGRLLAFGSITNTSSHDTSIYIWRTDRWEPISALTGLKGVAPVVCHPRLPIMTTAGQQPEEVFLWHLDLRSLLHEAPSPDVVHYANAKVVLAGESGVGKSGLALVLTGQPFAPTDSTHARHVWQLEQIETQQDSSPHEMHEIWLWDLAGQPDYRLIHQLHLHETTIALIVFDATSDTDPFAGIRHWQRALRHARQTRDSTVLPFTVLLVAARIDRGGKSVSSERIDKLVQELGCVGWVETSAKDGRGIAELSKAIRAAIDWTRLPKVTSTKLLQFIKTFVINEQQSGRLLRTMDDLYDAFLRTDKAPASSNELRQQFAKTLVQLEAQGIIHSFGFGNLILLQPERLDAYASALLIAAKDEPDGLGSIAEVRVQQGLFSVPTEDRLADLAQEKLLLIAMIDELVSHELVLREGGFLLFPSQSTCEHPDHETLAGKQIVTFTFTGPILSLYTTLVVRLAQSNIFQKQELWKYVVTYTNKLGGTYGLLLSPQGEERAELGLFFDEKAPENERFHFENFVHAHLERHAVGTIQRRRNFVCPTCGEIFPETQVSKRKVRGHTSIRCNICDTLISLLDGEKRLAASPASQVGYMEENADNQRDYERAVVTLPGKIAMQDFDVFLCHNEQDKPAVKQIGELLKQDGVLPWLDEWELRPGLSWQQALERQIQQTKAAAVFVGKDGIGPWQKQELDACLREFVDRGCPVIPVLLANAPKQPRLPVFLKAMTWVDFRKENPDPIQQLVWGITGRRKVGKKV